MWLPLLEEFQLNKIISDSFNPEIKGVAIFKHSTRCSISLMAKNRIERQWSYKDKELPLYYLDLLQYRGFSDLIAVRFKTEHQSPQLLVIKNEKVIYTSSHNDIRIDALAELIQ